MLTTQEAKAPEFATQRLRNLADSLISGKIITLVIETVSLCNLSCNFCDAHSGRSPDFKKNAGTMNPDTEQSLLASLEEYVYIHGPVHMIQFYGNGEPLLDKNLEAKIAYIKNRCLASQIRVITNGTLLTKERVTTLVDSGLDELHVSLDILDKSRYAFVKKLDASERVISNLMGAIEVIEHCKKTNLFIKYFKGGDSSDYGCKEEDGIAVEHFFSDYAKDSQYVHLKSQQLVDTGIGHLKGKTSFNKACEIPFYLLYIKHDGVVSACCTDVFSALEIGSLKNSSICDLLDSPALASIRLKHLLNQADQISLCAGCGNRTAVDTSELPLDTLARVEQSFRNKIDAKHP